MNLREFDVTFNTIEPDGKMRQEHGAVIDIQRLGSKLNLKAHLHNHNNSGKTGKLELVHPNLAGNGIPLTTAIARREISTYEIDYSDTLGCLVKNEQADENHKKNLMNNDYGIINKELDERRRCRRTVFLTTIASVAGSAFVFLILRYAGLPSFSIPQVIAAMTFIPLIFLTATMATSTQKTRTTNKRIGYLSALDWYRSRNIVPPRYSGWVNALRSRRICENLRKRLFGIAVCGRTETQRCSDIAGDKARLINNCIRYTNMNMSESFTTLSIVILGTAYLVLSGIFIYNLFLSLNVSKDAVTGALLLSVALFFYRVYQLWKKGEINREKINLEHSAHEFFKKWGFSTIFNKEELDIRIPDMQHVISVLTRIVMWMLPHTIKGWEKFKKGLFFGTIFYGMSYALVELSRNYFGLTWNARIPIGITTIELPYTLTSFTVSVVILILIIMGIKLGLEIYEIRKGKYASETYREQWISQFERCPLMSGGPLFLNNSEASQALEGTFECLQCGMTQTKTLTEQLKPCPICRDKYGKDIYRFCQVT